MAASKKVQSKISSSGVGKMSAKQFFIALSVAANIGFVVVVTTMMTSHVLDGMFMNEGLTRYCNAANDDKFSEAGDKAKALRAYTCTTDDAKKYFDDGFQAYLDYKNIK